MPPMLGLPRVRSNTLLVAAIVCCGAFATFAGAATQSAAGCNPSIRYCTPGVLPAGVYTTRYFLPGMRLGVPAEGWWSGEDSAVEFKIAPPGSSTTPPAIVFWIDPQADTTCTDRRLPVDMTTPARAVRWLRSNKNVIVSATRHTTIAGHLPALSVDLDVSPSAPRCDPSCPTPCIEYFLFFGKGHLHPSPDLAPGHTKGAIEGFGTGRGEPTRLYFAEIGKPSHLLLVAVDTLNRKSFATLTASATKLLATLRLPTKLPPKRH